MLAQGFDQVNHVFRQGHFPAQNLTGFRIPEFLILNPQIGIGYIPVEQVLAVFAVAFQIGSLDLLTDKLNVVRSQDCLLYTSPSPRD